MSLRPATTVPYCICACLTANEVQARMADEPGGRPDHKLWRGTTHRGAQRCVGQQQGDTEAQEQLLDPESPGSAAGVTHTLCMQDPPADLRPEQLERWSRLEPSALLMFTGVLLGFLWVPAKALHPVCAGLRGRVCVGARAHMCVHTGVRPSGARAQPPSSMHLGDVGLQQSCVPGAGTGRIYLGPVAH